jgi:signal transduction histidine kinase
LRWTIRNQIVIPLVAVQSLAIATTTAVTAELAARSSERRIVERLEGLVEVLRQSSFPHTDAVLERMAGLSGAQFVAIGSDGHPFARSASLLDSIDLGAARGLATTSLRKAPTVAIDGGSYRMIAGGAARTPDGSAGNLVVLYPESDRRRAQWEGTWPVLALGALALAIMAFWTGWTARRVGRRLLRVQEQVTRIAKGDTPVGVPTGPSDEIAELSSAVMGMGEDLRRLHEEIKRSERARVLAQVGAGLAHQLRNAITGARISLQLHARRSSPCATEPALNVALRQLDLTEVQVRGLLALGRDTEVKASLPCDMVAAVNEASTLLAPTFEHAGVHLTIQHMTQPLFVPTALADLRDAILNLVLNALEAVGANGGVEVSTSLDGSNAVIHVVDTGCGPTPDVKDALFDPFITTKPEGVGLGLALAHRVVIAAGGRLFWDRCDGRTRFIVELPLARSWS